MMTDPTKKPTPAKDTPMNIMDPMTDQLMNPTTDPNPPQDNATGKNIAKETTADKSAETYVISIEMKEKSLGMTTLLKRFHA